MSYLKKMYWYPPAETKIPLSAISGAFFSSAASFEEKLCDYLQIKNCILGNSGRALLYLLLESLKKKDSGKRNEVVIPGYTCYSVAAAIARAGLKIKVYDLYPKTLQTDYDSLKAAVSEKTLAIITQHLFGLPTLMHELKETAESKGAYLIEDAAQALGGALSGRPLGTLADFGIYSFGRGKPLPLGCGGALIGKNTSAVSNLIPKSTSKGYITLISASLTQIVSEPFLYWIPEKLPLGLGETIFDPDFSISAMPIAIKRLGSITVAHLEHLNTHRRHIAEIYKKALNNQGIIPLSGEALPVYTRFPLMAGISPIPEELKRLGVRRMYPQAILNVDTIKPYLADSQPKTPGAFEIAQKLITLPTHKGITKNIAKQIGHGFTQMHTDYKACRIT